MAEFCLQCAEKFGFPNDFEGLTSPEEWSKGRAAIVLCEECGPIQVDPDGRCVVDCRLHHGIVMALAMFLAGYVDDKWSSLTEQVMTGADSGKTGDLKALMQEWLTEGMKLYEQACKKGDANDKKT